MAPKARVLQLCWLRGRVDKLPGHKSQAQGGVGVVQSRLKGEAMQFLGTAREAEVLPGAPPRLKVAGCEILGPGPCRIMKRH